MKFKYAKVTNSRLMGSMGLLIISRTQKDKIYQYFLLDAEGLGIADYVSLKNPTIDQSHREEERLMGGLGADRIELTEEQALFLVNYYGNKNSYYEKPLPGNVEEYIEIIENHNTKLSIEDMYPIICKKFSSDIEFVNYMTMRFVAWDKESLKYFSNSEGISNMHITNINGTLLKNTVVSKGGSRYISDALFEDSDGYYTCKIAFSITNENNIYRINSILVGDKEPIFDFEVFDEISKSEFVSIYKVQNEEEFVEKFYKDNPFLLRSDTDEGVFFTRFNFDNNHVAKEQYLINDDIKAIYFYINGNFFVGTYTNRDRKYINKLLECNYSNYVTIDKELHFDENVLYDFVESGSDDFDYFLE